MDLDLYNTVSKRIITLFDDYEYGYEMDDHIAIIAGLIAEYKRKYRETGNLLYKSLAERLIERISEEANKQLKALEDDYEKQLVESNRDDMLGRIERVVSSLLK